MDKNITEYGIATGHDHYELVAYVDSQIKEGWQPFGNVFTTIQHEMFFIHQPMVKYFSPKKNKA